MLAPINRAQTTTCISLRDDAIDWPRVEAEMQEAKDSDETELLRRDQTSGELELRYVRDRINRPSSWRDLVPIIPGKTPCVFVIGVIPPDEMNRLDDECHCWTDKERSKELAWRAFLHGLRGIEGWHDGAHKPRMAKVDGLDYVAPDWLRETFVGPLRHVASEVGRLCWLWNQLSAGDTGN